jgi:hypothetical protein
MAHYAQIDSENRVIRVFVGRDDVVEGIADWETYYAPAGFTVKQTSYTGEFRFNYAGIGFAYDEARDAFVPPAPYPSWILNEDTCLWDAPIPHPADEADYAWDEETINWVPVDVEE